LSSVGILGGSFNPPHLAHLRLAETALSQLDLDEVWLVPVCQPPHKPRLEGDPGPRARLEMCELLISSSPLRDRLKVSPVEIERGGRSYTVDTLSELKAADPDRKLTLIVGSDSARSLAAWREPERILKLARLAVALRGERQEDVEAAILALAAEAEVVFLEMAPIGISSTAVRARLAKGRDVQDLVGEEVARYINDHRLYGSAALVDER
jgi:nicotinate-nucleotide adenylyltransferase